MSVLAASDRLHLDRVKQRLSALALVVDDMTDLAVEEVVGNTPQDLLEDGDFDNGFSDAGWAAVEALHRMVAWIEHTLTSHPEEAP